MDANLSTLGLILHELNIPNRIETIEDRVAIQKAVYLVQTFGVPLGYNFGWYLKGPYSPRLTKDYYALAENGGSVSGWVLKDSVVGSLNRVQQLIMAKPQHLPLHNWLELIASVHYLQNVSRYNREEIVSKIQDVKPHLAEFIDEGFAALA